MLRRGNFGEYGGPVASNEEWQDRAACRVIPVELFFPPAEQEVDEAKAV